MATATITPSAPAPAAAPAPVAAPSPAPSSSPAPVTSQPTGERKSFQQRLREDIIPKVSAEVSGTAPAKEVVTEQPTTATEVTTAPATDTQDADAAARGEEVVAKPVAEVTEEAPTLDINEPVGPAKFNELIAADAATKAFFEQHKDLKNSVMGALRRDSENRELRQYVPDLQSAKEMSTAAAQFSTLDGAFLGATNPEGAQNFIQAWANQAIVFDESGQPKVDGNGMYVMEPAFENVLQTVFSNRFGYLLSEGQKTGNYDPVINQALSVRLDALAKSAEESQDPRLQAAVDIIREAIPASSQPKVPSLPPELQRMADSVKADRAALDASRAQATQAANAQSIERSEAKTMESLMAQLTPVFSTSGLTKGERELAQSKIGAALQAHLDNHSWYGSQRNAILSRPPSEAREKALMAHDIKYANEALGSIAAATIRDIKSGQEDRQAVRSARVATQIQASITEPKGTSTGAPQQASLSDPTAVRAQVLKEYADKNGGRVMPMDERFREFARRGVGSQPRV